MQRCDKHRVLMTKQNIVGLFVIHALERNPGGMVRTYICELHQQFISGKTDSEKIY